MPLSNIFPILLVIGLFVGNSYEHDLVFNTDTDFSLWKFNGSYLYSKNMGNLASLIPPRPLQLTQQQEIQPVGVWLTRYLGPDADNFLSLRYSLNHHLIAQGWVRFLASKTVPIIVTTNDDAEVGRFWSDGNHWCDAVFQINLLKQVKVDIFTQNENDFALIDKIVIGAMSNISAIDNMSLNPCLTSPPQSMSTDDNVTDPPPPDMNVKPTSRNRYANQSHTAPDMIDKHHGAHMRNHHQHHQRPSPADGTDTKGAMAPKLDTSTTTNDNTVATTSDSSEVKCGCSCTCSRVKTRN